MEDKETQAGQTTLKDKTAKGLFWSALANAMQQLFNLSFGIILARLLNAQDYGMIGMLTIFSVIAGVLLDGGFAAALINKQDARQEDYNTVFWFSLSMGIILYITLYFCAPLIAQFYNKSELIPLSRYLFLGFLFGSAGIVPNAILIKRLIVKQRMIISVISLFISGIVGVTMAIHGMAYWGLATQNIVYTFCLMVLTWCIVPWHPTFKVDIVSLKVMLPFSIKIAITNIFNLINVNIMSVLIGKFYSVKEVGYYTQGNKWMTMGSSIVTSTLNSVAQPVLATMNGDDERQLNAFRKMLRFIAFISFPVMFGIALVSKELIIITISDKWLPSVSILQLLCIWGAIVPINNLYSTLLVSRGKSNIYLWNIVSLGCCQVIALLISSYFGIYVMIISFVIINIIWVGIWNANAKRYIHLNLLTALKDITPFFLSACVAVGISYICTMFITNLYLTIITKIIIAVAIYILIMKLSGSIIFKESLEYILKRLKKSKA